MVKKILNYLYISFDLLKIFYFCIKYLIKVNTYKEKNNVVNNMADYIRTRGIPIEVIFANGIPNTIKSVMDMTKNMLHYSFIINVNK